MLLQVRANGWVKGVLQRPSPNRDARPFGVVVDLVVIHAISLPKRDYSSDWVERLFLNALEDSSQLTEGLQQLRVSAHFFIRRKGEIMQFVSCNERAWHAGISSFLGKSCCNDFSIGIELEGTDDSPFMKVQYTQLVCLIHTLSKVYPLRYMTGHEDIAKGRKTDPGPFFDWDVLAKETGLSRK